MQRFLYQILHRQFLSFGRQQNGCLWPLNNTKQQNKRFYDSITTFVFIFHINVCMQGLKARFAPSLNLTVLYQRKTPSQFNFYY